jgi:ribosomal protein S16
MEQLTAINTEQLLQETQILIAEAKNFLISEGKIVDFGKFLTIKKYCEKYNIKEESKVTNWIRRGVIPAEDVHTFTELNNLRMIRDKIYKI